MFDKPKRRTKSAFATSSWAAEALSLVLASAVTITLGSYTQGCSKQGEGERCNKLAGDNGNDDCEDGLVCVSQDVLLGGSDICCPPQGSINPACIPGALTGAGGAGGEGGASVSSSTTGGGQGGNGGTAGAAGHGGEGGQGGAAGGGGAPGGNGGTAGQGGTGG